jgi:acetylornithine/N-succinyldiaminopimelate aminotransferase
VPFGDHRGGAAAIGPETAGILIEPVQGEGGMRPVPHAVPAGSCASCATSTAALIFDEVQCGVGRTGKLFAHEWAGIAPDVMAIAKGIGGGFPIGACLATEEGRGGHDAGTHGTTFGGNPLAMAVGNAVLDVVLAPGFLDHVAQMGLRLRCSGSRELATAHPDVVAEEVRGRGCCWA